MTTRVSDERLAQLWRYYAAKQYYGTLSDSEAIADALRELQQFRAEAAARTYYRPKPEVSAVAMVGGPEQL